MQKAKAHLWSEEYQNKLIHPDDIEQKVAVWKLEGKRITTLNGSFDLLHAGHLQIIYEASCQTNFLIVALNSDDSIRQYKGEHRPIISLEQRLQMMAALSFVDYVTWFSELDPRVLLGKIQPHLHVNGAEYGKKCIEASIVEQGGGEVHIVHLVPGLSTSSIIKKIETGVFCAADRHSS